MVDQGATQGVSIPTHPEGQVQRTTIACKPNPNNLDQVSIPTHPEGQVQLSTSHRGG